MGLTSSSTGSNMLNNKFNNSKRTSTSCTYTIALSGNPNVRKIKYF